MLLPAVYILRHHTPIRHDLHTIAMLTGAATGVVSGFLSGIVRESHVHSAIELKQGQHGTVHLLYHLEFLHLPVICGSLLYSYCLVFDKLPSVRATKQAIFTGFVGGILFTASYIIIAGNSPAYVLMRMFLFSFVLVFLSAYMTVIRNHQKPWLITVIAYIMCLHWESGHFDSLIWDFESSRFPIPGSITGMIIVFGMQVHVIYKQGYNLPFTFADSYEPMEISELHFNILIWQGITYITEQLSLALIQTTKPKLSGEHHDKPSFMFSCLTMAAYIGVMSSYFRTSLIMKVYIVLALLTMYITLTLSAMVLHNGYFIEIVMGYTIALTTHPHSFK